MGTRHDKAGRPLPLPNPTTRPHFDGLRERRFVMQRCPRDGFFFYPRSRCPACLGADWTWQTASGRGRVHSFTVDRAGHVPALTKLAPYGIAIVELEEGPRCVARIVDCDPERLAVDLPVEVAYEDVEGGTLANFRPRRDRA
jgi:uncharacterized OB-fold protein